MRIDPESLSIHARQVLGEISFGTVGPVPAVILAAILGINPWGRTE